MRREFRLSEVMITMFHGHGKEDTTKGRVNSCRGDLFDKRMKAVKMKDGQNSVGESGHRHSKRYAKVGGQVLRGREGMVPLRCCNIMEQTNQFLTDQIFLEQREILYGAKDDGTGKDGGVKRMGGKGG